MSLQCLDVANTLRSITIRVAAVNAGELECKRLIQLEVSHTPRSTCLCDLYRSKTPRNFAELWLSPPTLEEILITQQSGVDPVLVSPGLLCKSYYMQGLPIAKKVPGVNFRTTEALHMLELVESVACSYLSGVWP